VNTEKEDGDRYGGNCLAESGKPCVRADRTVLLLITLPQRDTADLRNRFLFSVTRRSACATALCLQIFSINHLVRNEGGSVLMDNSPAEILVAASLPGGTRILNAITLCHIFSGKRRKTGTFQPVRHAVIGITVGEGRAGTEFLP